MDYLFLFLITVGIYFQNICVKQFNTKIIDVRNASIIYSMFMSLSAAVVLGILFVFNHNICTETIFYAIGFGISFATTLITQNLSIKEGPLSLTALIVSFSLLLPAIYGVIFLSESLSVFGYIGLVLLALSLLLINKLDRGEKINKKWIIYVFIAFLSNGMCCVFQKLHQSNVAEKYSVTFQFFSMVISAVLLFSALLFLKTKKIGFVLKNGGKYAVASGLANSMCNRLMLILAVTMKASILYPIVSAGGIALVFITSLLFYKEHFSKAQYIGYISGILAIVLLNI